MEHRNGAATGHRRNERRVTAHRDQYVVRLHAEDLLPLAQHLSHLAARWIVNERVCFFRTGLGDSPTFRNRMRNESLPSKKAESSKC